MFGHSDAEKISGYDETKIQSLLADEGIIRNQLKIRSVISNTIAFIGIQEMYGSFDQYIWQYADCQTIINYPQTLSEVPVRSTVSDGMRKNLQRKGVKFVETTICYAYMQAVGMVDDHVYGCCRKQS